MRKAEPSERGQRQDEELVDVVSLSVDRTLAHVDEVLAELRAGRPAKSLNRNA
jgi:hypothetical protein